MDWSSLPLFKVKSWKRNKETAGDEPAVFLFVLRTISILLLPINHGKVN